MRKLSQVCVLLLVTWSLVGCASSSVDVFGKVRVPIKISQVKVFMSAPDVAYEKVARVKARVQQGLDSGARLQATILSLQALAAKIGANGLVVMNAKAFDAAYNRISTGTALFSGASLSRSPQAFQSVVLIGQAIHIGS